MPDAAPPPDAPHGRALLESAARHATTSVPIATPRQSAGEVRAALAGRAFDSADDVAVLEGETLVGVVPIERLMAAGAAEPLEQIMDPDPPVVQPGVDQEIVAWQMVAHGESSVAVVGADGRFAGLIPPRTMLSVLLSEHDEDMARLGGYLHDTRVARRAAEESVGRRLWHWLPWLLIGLLGAMAAAVIVGAFEEQLSEKVLLAFFVPGVVYMADAVGTQTETVVIRGLTAGVPIASVVRREVLTGLAIGVAIALAFFPFALLVWDDSGVALAVALALLASCSIATMVAMFLPWVLHRAGSDPAFGSGPLATVIQDLLSVTVYLLIATAIAT